jgi:hypothetical protein
MKLSVLRDVIFILSQKYRFVVYRGFKKCVGKHVVVFSFTNIGRLFRFDISFNHHFYHMYLYPIHHSSRNSYRAIK